MFIYFVYQNYQSSINEAFISLQSDSGDCDSVAIAVNGNYLADVDGNWQGTPDYLDSAAIYQLSFSNFEINSNTQYISMMTSFYDSLISLGKEAVNYNLAINLIIWITWIEYYSVSYPQTTNFTAIGFGQLQSFTMTAMPSVVFDLSHARSNVAAVSGSCNVTGYTSYDQANR